jgi:hypothetical protein
MVHVLNQRDSIERYLTNLKIERIKPESELAVFDDTKVERKIQKSGVITTEKIPVKETVIPKTVTISADKKLPAPVISKGYTFDPNSNQNVLMILTKVDPVYNVEARNAFTRYNAQKHYKLELKVTRDTLDQDRALLIFSDFVSADEAIKYLDQVRRDAPREVSWLPKDKYVFYIISNENLEILKNNKNLKDYLDLLHSKYPEKF